MKRLFSIFAAILLTALSVNVYAQKNKTENDYNLKKAYEVLNEEKDEAKALDLVNKQLRAAPGDPGQCGCASTARQVASPEERLRTGPEGHQPGPESQ